VRGPAGELVVEVLRSKDGHFDEEQFARDRARLGVVQDGLHEYEVFELAARLLDDAVLPADDDAHPAQIADLGVAHDERVDVEAAAGEDSRYARQHHRARSARDSSARA